MISPRSLRWWVTLDTPTRVTALIKDTSTATATHTRRGRFSCMGSGRILNRQCPQNWKSHLWFYWQYWLAFATRWWGIRKATITIDDWVLLITTFKHFSIYRIITDFHLILVEATGHIFRAIYADKHSF